MRARTQRFFNRVRGTQRLIFFAILVYDIYLYYQMLQHGMAAFVVTVVAAGLVSGTVVAWLLANSPTMMERVMNAAGYGAMAVFLLSQGAKIQFPMWVYVVSHILLWFWFSTYFWFASRPYEFEFTVDADHDENTAGSTTKDGFA